MKITDLKINNYRSLIDFELKDISDTAILYGENNAGKSNVLNALYTIFKAKRKINPSGSFSSRENFYEGIVENFSNNFYNNIPTNIITFNIKVIIDKNELKINQTISTLFKETNNIVEIEGKIVPRATDIDQGEITVTSVVVNTKVIYLKNGTSGVVTYFPSLAESGGATNTSELASAFTELMSVFNDCVYIIGSNRDMHIAQMANVPKKLPRNITNGDFKNILHGLYLNPKEHHKFEKIDELLSKPPFKFGHISFSAEGSAIDIMIKEDKIRFPIKHLGSGVLQSLYIITSVICCERKIVCIEELEQNLSPNRQKITLGKLRDIIGENDNPLSQLFISSHSPYFYDKDLHCSLYFLKINEGKTQIAATRGNQPTAAANAEPEEGYVEYYKEHFPGVENFY